VIQRNKEILQSFAKIAESRYSVGEGIQQDVIKAHVEVSKMVDELIMLGQRKERSKQVDLPVEQTRGCVRRSASRGGLSTFIHLNRRTSEDGFGDDLS